MDAAQEERMLIADLVDKAGIMASDINVAVYVRAIAHMIGSGELKERVETEWPKYERGEYRKPAS